MYYRIRHSLSPKIVGDINQIQRSKLPDNWENNPSFIENIEFKRVDFEPIMATGILYKKAKLTDLIRTIPVGFTRKLLISPALKKIFQTYDQSMFQYFECSVEKDNQQFEYWVVSPTKPMYNYVDFEKSRVVTMKRKVEGGTFLEPVAVDSQDEFLDYLSSEGGDSWKTTIDHVYIKEDTVDDVFALGNVDGGVGYYASENFKTAIEQHGFTGIEFAPSHLNSIEWLHNERKNRYQ
ncbi:imm11 family protein [Pedobacter sp. KLB.chiD]|uniref:imm11 family protein n=1 Tax=Pedobacter sp. KLB.chiD TaxID=3387402 RepID=UPI003999FA2F